VRRKKQPQGKNRGKGDLRSQILKLVAERPLDKVELSKQLDLPPDERGALRNLLSSMERDGELARIRKDRYVIPQEADLFTGVIQFHASGTAHVLAEKAGEADLFIAPENSWTAMHGDRVVARLVREKPSFDQPRGRQPRAARQEGRVIRVLERANETIVGTLQKTRNFFFVVADDPRFVHNLYVPEPKPPLRPKVGDKVVAKLDSWPTRHVNPEGHVVEVLGAADAPGVDMLSIIRKHRLPGPFPEEVEREARALVTEIPAEELKRREDLRGNFIFTIDPDDAKDFDDAINVERTGQGWRVGIHIADVSHYIRPKSPLDREALDRGNSVYLADRVIPMLPEALSNGICSLRPDEDHLTFSVFAEVNRKGKVTAARFAKTVIRSKARLTYKQAFALLQKPPTDDLSKRLHVAWELSSTLRKARFAHGSLDLDFPEVKVWLDENGRPERLEKVENDISHQLIEELMLLANELVARELMRAKQPTVYRIHEKPDAEKLTEFRETALAQGIRCGDLSNRPELQRLLALSKGKPQEYAIKLGLLKSLKRACYAPDPLGHYGLNKSDYTHFTSPIRRYSDLIVHRSLERQLGLNRRGPDSAGLAKLCEHISTTERTASDAERDSTKLKKLEFFQMQVAKRTGEPFKARIMEVRNYGLFVELPEFLMSGLIHVSAMDSDFYMVDVAKGRLIGKRSKKVYQVGDEIEVLVARVDMFKQQVDFQPA
jgi:ribonuclease R